MNTLNNIKALCVGGCDTIYYGPDLQDRSVCAMAEYWASKCKAPIRWLKADLWGNSVTYTIHTYGSGCENIMSFEQQDLPTHGIRKICRIVGGIFGACFLAPFAIPLMGIAFLSEEIRLKYTLRTLRPFTEYGRLKELVAERQSLAIQAQDCEPVSCCLSMICSLLCYIACFKKSD